ncbi:MAG: cytochrome c3 family protein [Fimbriimonas sp.]
MKIEAIVLAAGLALLLFCSASSSQKGTGNSQADKLFARAKEDDFMGDRGCAECHSKVSKNFKASPHATFMVDPKLPLAKRGCEGCHGPGQIHQAEMNSEVIAFRKMSAKESSAACLRCHGQTLNESHWKRTEHARADVSCVSCHQIHPDSDPDLHGVKKGKAVDPRTPVFVAKVESKSMLRADEATLCGSCHAPQIAEFRSATHHPVPEGSMLCSDCHVPHDSKASKTKHDATKSACVTCHTEKAGPFVFEHDPVSSLGGNGCQECHRPHGSNNPKMLNSVSRGLCAQCHTDKLGSHYPGQTCWTAGCHVASHGSNTSSKFLRP